MFLPIVAATERRRRPWRLTSFSVTLQTNSLEGLVGIGIDRLYWNESDRGEPATSNMIAVNELVRRSAVGKVRVAVPRVLSQLTQLG